MIEQVKLNLYYFYKASWKTIAIFWSIYLGFVFALMLLTIAFQAEISFMGVSTLPSFIFTMIYGLIFFKETFPQAIKFGVNRQSYFISIWFYFIFFTIVMTIIGQVLLSVVNLITNIFSIDNFKFVGFNYQTVTNTMDANLILYEGLLYIFIFLLTMLIGAVYFRYGMKIGTVIVITIPLMLIVFREIAAEMLELLTYLVFAHENYTIFAFLVPYIIFSTLIYLAIRKASVIDQVSFKS